MSLNTICDDLLINIMSFINDNRSSYSFANSCKYLQNLFSKNGYLKSLKVGGVINNNIYDFSIMYTKHYRTIKGIYVSHILDPHVWIPGNLCRNVYFLNCNFTSIIKPDKDNKIEELFITSHGSKKIIIDFTNLNILKRLYIFCYDTELLNIEKCVELNLFKIRLQVKNKIMPEFLSKIKSNISNKFDLDHPDDIIQN